jgi:anti-anti-sigma factor
MEEAVYYKSENGTVYMKATGHVTALVCSPLKTAIFERIDAEPPVEKIYLELSDCEYMDSTFLGLIVGTQKRFARLSAGREGACRSIVLLGVNAACKGLLRTIGVLGMVELSDERVPFPPDLERLTGAARASARFILDAHEELSDLSTENRKRFATLSSLLKNSLEDEPSKDK